MSTGALGIICHDPNSTLPNYTRRINKLVEGEAGHELKTLPYHGGTVQSRGKHNVVSLLAKSVKIQRLHIRQAHKSSM